MQESQGSSCIIFWGKSSSGINYGRGMGERGNTCGRGRCIRRGRDRGRGGEKVVVEKEEGEEEGEEEKEELQVGEMRFFFKFVVLLNL